MSKLQEVVLKHIEDFHFATILNRHSEGKRIALKPIKVIPNNKDRS